HLSSWTRLLAEAIHHGIYFGKDNTDGLASVRWRCTVCGISAPTTFEHASKAWQVSAHTVWRSEADGSLPARPTSAGMLGQMASWSGWTAAKPLTSPATTSAPSRSSRRALRRTTG